jgi:hypothetical protein
MMQDGYMLRACLSVAAGWDTVPLPVMKALNPLTMSCMSVAILAMQQAVRGCQSNVLATRCAFL